MSSNIISEFTHSHLASKRYGPLTSQSLLFPLHLLGFAQDDFLQAVAVGVLLIIFMNDYVANTHVRCCKHMAHSKDSLCNIVHYLIIGIFHTTISFSSFF